MKFGDYINEAKLLKGTMIGFKVDEKRLSNIKKYIESWLVRYKIDYEKVVNPHVSIAMMPGEYEKDELVREINTISKNISFNPKGMSIFRGINVKKDFITLEYKPNKEMIENYKKISSKFETIKFDQIKPHVSLFTVEQGTMSDKFFEDVRYSLPKIPKLKVIGVELWNQKFKKEYVKEGSQKFWKGKEEYSIREVGTNKYEVTVFVRGDTPESVYIVNKLGSKWFCNCPARKGTDKHVSMVQEWIKAGKPSDFGKNVKGDVLNKLKKMGVKV